MLGKNDAVLITGGTGSFGKTCYGTYSPGRRANTHFQSRRRKTGFTAKYIAEFLWKYFIGDVRDRESVDRAMKGVKCVFHAAALKQVPSCEYFPLEAGRTNVLGAGNVSKSAVAHDVQSVVCLSTDKAVLPVNAMGLSKAMMEKFAQAEARALGPASKTVISIVRYGNVMFSRGSVIPLFIQQIKNGKPITITEPNMTRFLMPLHDSVALGNHAF